MLRLFNLLGMRFGVNAAWRIFAVWLPLLALLAGAAAGAWGGWQVGRAPLQVELAQLRESHSEAARVAAIATARRLQAAHERSDVLGGQLAQALASNSQLSQEKTHALRLAATGRVCLSERALSVLNGSPGLSVAGFDGVPAPEPAAAAPHGASAPNSDPAAVTGTAPAGAAELFASDEDIGSWAIGAGAQFEQCRARLDALIDWHTIPGATP